MPARRPSGRGADTSVTVGDTVGDWLGVVEPAQENEIIEHRVGGQTEHDGGQQDRLSMPVDTAAEHDECQWCKDEENHSRAALYQDHCRRHAPPGLRRPRARHNGVIWSIRRPGRCTSRSLPNRISTASATRPAAIRRSTNGLPATSLAAAAGKCSRDARGEGSPAYVANERVTGTLQGHSGGISLHHTGIMTRGTPQLSWNALRGRGKRAGGTPQEDDVASFG